MRDEVSKAEIYFKSQKKGVEATPPPEELFTKAPMGNLKPEQINKGEKRLQFKHPLMQTSIFSVLWYLKPIKMCIDLCGCGSSKERDEKKSQEKKKKNRNNKFYAL